jgi:hypothetical protein
MKWNEILVQGNDANASLRVWDRHDNSGHDCIMGRFGIPHVNVAGRKMLQILDIHELCVISRKRLQ